MEQQVVTNFRLSDKSLLDRIMLDRGVWWLLGGWVLFAASESVNGPASDPGCELNACSFRRAAEARSKLRSNAC